ncbi:hypothetical protein [Streptomyces sp. NPDC057909]|uniref:hypothetical protein n=1 Tax=Streptomyces sp. NPDC057909 TaxID=3346277 RepID=UPI0036DFD517
MSRYGTTRSSYGRDAHPGALLSDRDEIEADRRFVLDGNGADDEPDYDYSQDDGWTVLS